MAFNNYAEVTNSDNIAVTDRTAAGPAPDGSAPAGSADWSSITGTPTSAAGYGIVNGSELDAFAALGATGLVTRTAANTYAARTLTAGDNVSITNGSGVGGNPTIAVPSMPWADVTGTPTTLAGYGITDAQGFAWDVKWSGATGDGVTLDTADIQDAIDNHEDILFSAGTYLVESSILIPSNRRLYFAVGAILKLRSGSTGSGPGHEGILANEDFDNGNENIEIYDAVIDGNEANNVGVNRTGMDFRGVQHLKIKRAFIYNVSDDAVYVGNSTNHVNHTDYPDVSDIYGENCGRNILSVVDSRWGSYRNIAGTNSGYAGIDVEPNDANDILENVSFSDVNINGALIGIVVTNAGGGICSGLAFSNFTSIASTNDGCLIDNIDDTVWSNLVVQDCATGVGTHSGIRINNCERTTLSSVVSAGADQQYGLWEDGTTSGTKVYGFSGAGNATAPYLMTGAGSVMASDSIIGLTALGVGTKAPDGLAEFARDAGTPILYLTGYDSSSTGGRFLGRAARGSQASPTATQANDILAFLQGRGYGATGWVNTTSAAIGLFAGGNFTDTSTPTYISFLTTTAGSTGGVERARVTSAGNFLVGTTDETGMSAGSARFGVNTYTAGLGFYSVTGLFLSAQGATTSSRYMNVSNTSGQVFFGVEASSGGTTFTGSAAYAGLLGTNVNQVMQFGTDGTVRATLSNTGFALTGTIQTGAPSGGTAQPWKLGSIVTAASALDATRYVEAEINGVACKLALIT